MSSKPSLPALAKAGSEVAQAYFERRRLAYFGALFVALLMLLPIGSIVYGFAVIAMLLEILAWWLRYQGEHYHRVSRELTRRSLLLNSFNQSNEPLEITDLLSQFNEQRLTQRALQLDKTYQGQYYDTQNLLDNLQESAFWSKHLFKTIARQATLLLLFISSVIIFVVFFLEPLLINHDISLIPKIIVVFLAFVISDELSSAFAWREAANRCEAIDRRLEQLRSKPLAEHSQEVILAVFSDYAVATATAPPIPTYAYHSQREHLNSLWEQRKQQTQ
jgi:membrane protein implicated in regulation of membrane protease activity